jgi:hypothetical protein
MPRATENGYVISVKTSATWRDRARHAASATALAFPDGSMTASRLHRECSRGRLVIERIAGKDHTTLGDEYRYPGTKTIG